MSKLITLDSFDKRRNLATPLTRADKARKRSAKGIAMQGHNDVMLRMNYLKNRAQKAASEHRALVAERRYSKITPAWIFTDNTGVLMVVEADTEWSARLQVERAYGIEARNTVVPYRRS